MMRPERPRTACSITLSLALSRFRPVAENGEGIRGVEGTQGSRSQRPRKPHEADTKGSRRGTPVPGDFAGGVS